MRKTRIIAGVAALAMAIAVAGWWVLASDSGGLTSATLSLTPSGTTLKAIYNGTGLPYVTYTASTSCGTDVSIWYDGVPRVSSTTGSVSINVPTTNAGEINIFASDANGQQQALLLVVQVLFEPESVLVESGKTGVSLATIFPQSAVPHIAFLVQVAEIASLDKTEPVQSPDTLSITGLSPGSTRVVAFIAGTQGTEEVGVMSVEIGAKFVPVVSAPDSHTLVSDGSGVISTDDMSLPNY